MHAGQEGRVDKEGLAEGEVNGYTRQFAQCGPHSHPGGPALVPAGCGPGQCRRALCTPPPLLPPRRESAALREQLLPHCVRGGQAVTGALTTCLSMALTDSHQGAANARNPECGYAESKFSHHQGAHEEDSGWEDEET